MPETGNAKDFLELPPTNVSIFTLKNATWRIYLISFTVQYCFLFRFVCIELVSLIWFLQIWVEIYVYGTMINWSSLIKKLMQTCIVDVSWCIFYVSTVHLNVIWHLIWRYLSQPVLGGYLVLSGHYSIPRGCPLNTGITVPKTTRNISTLNTGETSSNYSNKTLAFFTLIVTWKLFSVDLFKIPDVHQPLKRRHSCQSVCWSVFRGSTIGLAGCGI